MDLKDQLLLEEDLILHGAERYKRMVANAESKGRAADTGYGATLARNLVTPVAAALREFCESDSRQYGKYRTILKKLDANVLAYIGIKTTLNVLSTAPTATYVAASIGRNIEDELRFSSFKDLNPEYYATIMQDFNRKNTKSYRHMRNVLSVTAKKKGMEYEAWSNAAQVGVGAVVVNAILNATDLLTVYRNKNRRGKTAIHLVASAEATKWIQSYNAHTAVLHPYTKPCVIPPDDWDGLNSGGYWSESMRMRTPFIKGINKALREFIEPHDMSTVYAGVNALQKTKWAINEPVLNILKTVWNGYGAEEVGLPSKEPIDIPKFGSDLKPEDMDEDTKHRFLQWKREVAELYTAETKRSSKAFEVSRVVGMATEYSKYTALWFVYQCDFRGRVYASSAGVNPQGADYNKAVLRFAEGKVIGQSGLYWLAVHGANCYGVDKCSFDSRVDWVMDNIAMINAIVEDPYSTTAQWGAASSPFMFLAFCLEFAEAVKNPNTFVSYLPVGMDGSCNGLQNFSALLRDSVGGRATNLVPSDKPADIYQEVASKCLDLIQQDEDIPERSAWLAYNAKYGITRQLTKRSVMTLPYGSTKFACFKFVREALGDTVEFFEDSGQAVKYFVDILWQAIAAVVVAAREAMAWLHKLAEFTARRGFPLWWITPSGFPVYQCEMDKKQVKVRTNLMGFTSLSTLQDTNKISPSKQAQSVAPNFVHSLDAAHMLLTVLSAEACGIDSFMMVHDDFGVHAADVELFRQHIQTTFVTMYRDNEPLHDLYVTVALSCPDGAIPPVPSYGTLNINDVLNSEYFFS